MQPTDAPQSPRSASSSKTASDPYLVLRNRDYVVYLIGRLVAVFGQQMLVVAVGWELYERTHSAMALGFVGPDPDDTDGALHVAAGHFADNFERSRSSPSPLGSSRCELRLDGDQRAPRAGGLDLRLPAGRWRGADVSVAGERVLHAAPGAATPVFARGDVEQWQLPFVLGRWSGGGAGR